jgi:hypothetical protein
VHTRNNCCRCQRVLLWCNDTYRQQAQRFSAEHRRWSSTTDHVPADRRMDLEHLVGNDVRTTGPLVNDFTPAFFISVGLLFLPRCRRSIGGEKRTRTVKQRRSKLHLFDLLWMCCKLAVRLVERQIHSKSNKWSLSLCRAVTDVDQRCPHSLSPEDRILPPQLMRNCVHVGQNSQLDRAFPLFFRLHGTLLTFADDPYGLYKHGDARLYLGYET